MSETTKLKEEAVNPTKKKLTKQQKGLTIAGVVVVALGAIYACGNSYFTNHYFPSTTINGIDTSMKDSKEALKLVKTHLSNYELKIHSEDGDMKIKAEEAGLVYDKTEEVAKVLEKQNHTGWISEIFKKHKYTAMETTVDDKKLSKTVDKLACMKPKKVKKSERARIKYDSDQKKYIIKEAVVGNQVVKKELLSGVKTAMLTGEKQLDMTTKAYYKQPKYTSDSEKVLKAKEKVDKYMKTVIHLEDGNRTYDIDADDIHKFIKISNDYKISLSKSEISDFIQDSVWKVMNTTDKAKIIDSPGSGMFYVADSEDAKVVRVRTESEQIMKDIKKGKEVTRKPDYMKDFLVSDYGDIVGDTYVDISIGGQHVWAIQNGEVVLSTPVVTGNVSTGHASPTGIYTIKWKTTNYTMKKYNAHVNYWMPYDTNEGIGFHDATWRGSFGGSIYYYSGSHGCINMPYSAARSLYYIADKGWPVIVH